MLQASRPDKAATAVCRAQASTAPLGRNQTGLQCPPDTASRSQFVHDALTGLVSMCPAAGSRRIRSSLNGS